MPLFPRPLSPEAVLPDALLKVDKKAAIHYGGCALGKKALYLGGRWTSRVWYLPLGRVERVYKRLAVSKGYYEGKVYGSLSYLVVRYGKGQEKAFRFEREPDLDDLLSALRRSTSIPIGKP